MGKLGRELVEGSRALALAFLGRALASEEQAERLLAEEDPQMSGE